MSERTRPMGDDLAPRGSPPSTYSILALLEGQPGAVGAVTWETVRRMGLIAPALWIAGFRGRDVIRGSVAATLGITLGLIGYYSYYRANGRSI